MEMLESGPSIDWLDEQREAAWKQIVAVVPESGPRVRILAEAFAAFRLQAPEVEPDQWLSLLHRVVGQAVWRWYFAQPDREPGDGYLMSIAHRVFARERDAWELAADTLQQVKLKLLDDGPLPSKAGAMKSWLGSLVRNRAYDWVRSEHGTTAVKRVHESLSPERHYWVPAEDAVDPLCFVEMQFRHDRLIKAIQGLPAPLRRTIVLRFFAEDRLMPYSEIGRQMRVSEDTVKKRLQRAWKLLRAELADLGAEDSFR